VSASPFLLVEDVCERYSVSKRWVLKRTRTGTIPHRRLPGSRRCLFVEADLAAWENGASLEVRELGAGGRLVRPADRNGRP
jgi:predicted DNA-binding transcriptional regulator AlpA